MSKKRVVVEVIATAPQVPWAKTSGKHPTGKLKIPVAVTERFDGLESSLRSRLGHYNHIHALGIVDGGQLVPFPPEVRTSFRAF